MIVHHFLKYVRNGKNRELLSWFGGGMVVVVTAIWAVLTYVFPHAETGKPPSITVGTGLAAGHDNVIHGPVSIGLNEKVVRQEVTAAQKPLAWISTEANRPNVHRRPCPIWSP
jgi:hypothetical protein